MMWLILSVICLVISFVALRIWWASRQTPKYEPENLPNAIRNSKPELDVVKPDRSLSYRPIPRREPELLLVPTYDTGIDILAITAAADIVSTTYDTLSDTSSFGGGDCGGGGSSFDFGGGDGGGSFD